MLLMFFQSRAFTVEKKADIYEVEKKMLSAAPCKVLC